MIIANPIYDLVFKTLMLEERLAKFFLETLMNEIVQEIVVKPQEVYFTLSRPENGEPYKEVTVEGRPIAYERNINHFRLDFIATVKTADGEYKKVLIELQKARKLVDVDRFRNYLGIQYRTVDLIGEGGEEKKSVSLPIVTIYLLGFELGGLSPAATKIARVYRDLQTGEEFPGKDSFVEKLTHDCYIVQLPKIKKSHQSRLERLLNLFEQDGFIDERHTLKIFDTSGVYEREIIDMANLLHFVCSDSETRQRLEAEIEGDRIQKVYDDQLQEMGSIIQEKENVIQEKENVIQEKENVIQEKENVILEKESVILEKENALQEKENVLQEKEKALKEKENVLQEKERQVEEMKKIIESFQNRPK